MTCKHCGGAMVMRFTLDIPVDERGIYYFNTNEPINPTNRLLVCTQCGGEYEFEERENGGDYWQVSFTYGIDPEPLAGVYIQVKGGMVKEVLSNKLLGVVLEDMDVMEQLECPFQAFLAPISEEQVTTKFSEAAKVLHE